MIVPRITYSSDAIIKDNRISYSRYIQYASSVYIANGIFDSELLDRCSFKNIIEDTQEMAQSRSTAFPRNQQKES